MNHSYCYRSYNALDVSEFKHYLINNSELFAHEHNQKNGIENFYNQAKRYLKKCNVVPKNNFKLFLKECEWRFNMVSPKKLLQELKLILILKELYWASVPNFFKLTIY